MTPARYHKLPEHGHITSVPLHRLHVAVSPEPCRLVFVWSLSCSDCATAWPLVDGAWASSRPSPAARDAGGLRARGRRRCGECQKGDIDQDLNGNGRYDVEWYGVPCNVGDSKLSYVTVSKSQWIFAFVVANHRRGRRRAPAPRCGPAGSRACGPACVCPQRAPTSPERAHSALRPPSQSPPRV